MASSRKSFDRSTTGTEVAAAFKEQIRDKHILVTGVRPHSIGESTALALASGGPALLILASRTESNLQEVARKIKDRRPNVTVHTVVVDLASLGSVRDAARRIRSLTSTLHILINNAGVSLSKKQWSPDGVELTFASNHLGPFLLTNLLIPTLAEAAQNSPPGTARIVNVSSSGHLVSPFRFSDYNFDGKPLAPDEQPRKNLPEYVYEENDGFPGVIAYGSSKTANILFSVALNDRLGSRGIKSFAVDPGDIKTNLTREIGARLMDAIEETPANAWKSPDQGCATSLVAALDPNLSDAEEVLYLADCRKSRTARYATDKEKAGRLWALSENLTNLANKHKL